MVEGTSGGVTPHQLLRLYPRLAYQGGSTQEAPSVYINMFAQVCLQYQGQINGGQEWY